MEKPDQKARSGIDAVTQDLSDKIFDEERMYQFVLTHVQKKNYYQTLTALPYAKKMHEGQYRKQGHGKEPVPYIYHPLMVTCHAMALGFQDDELLSVCLLHDVCEDCGVAPEALPVNENIQNAVRLLTKKKESEEEKKDTSPEAVIRRQKEKERYYRAIAGNRLASIVKLIDRCHNISSMATSSSDGKMADYIMETQEFVYDLMTKTRENYPEFSDQLFLIRYQMYSVVDALRHHMRSSMDRR